MRAEGWESLPQQVSRMSHGREGVRGGDSFPGPYLAFDSVTPIEEIRRQCSCKTGSEP